jgi:transposase
LLKSPWNLNAVERGKLDGLQRANRGIFRGYLLEESLAGLLDLRQPWLPRRRLHEWFRWASRSKPKPFVKLARTLRTHVDGVIAHVKTGLTNGPLEGTNNKARLIGRRAVGFHSAQAFTATQTVCCGRITPDPPLQRPTGTSCSPGKFAAGECHHHTPPERLHLAAQGTLDTRVDTALMKRSQPR